MNNRPTPTRTFGIEIEAFGVDRGIVAARITAAGVVCHAEGYNHSTPRNWKVVTDASISGSSGFEVVSPILSGDDGMAQVRIVMDTLAAIGAKVNKSTGLHVHIGAADFSLREFRQIARNYVIFEDFFDAIMPPSRRKSDNVYIRSNRAAMGGDYTNAATKRAVEKLDRCNTIDEIINAACPGLNGRYHKLNLTAYWRHGTIEFRQHSGTVDAEKALNWISLLLQFVNRAAVTRQIPTEKVSTPQSQVFSAFFRSFQIAGLREYFQARRRAFYPAR